VVSPQWAARFATQLGRLAEAFDAPVSPERADVYTEALADIRIEALEAAAKEIAAHSDWFPRPAQWRAAAKQWEAAEAERERIRLEWERSRHLALPAPGRGPVSREEALTNVRAIIDQMRYVVSRKPDDRPHNRPAESRLPRQDQEAADHGR
jgi:ribosomal protein L12E/L44/L45/RPP1/RPP2